ncbi:poly-gamma-glutamate system protein, partial [Fusobacterium sp.]
NTSIAYSFGGIDDVAKEFEQEVIEEIKNRNRKYNLILFYNSNLEENIEQRYKFYQERGAIKLFINVGGNSLAFGKSYKDIENSDLILPKKLQIRDGLVGKFYSSGVPVIHLLNIKGIALKNKIPIDSVEKSEIGTGAVFFEDINSMKYNLIIIILVLIFFVYNAKIMKKFEVKS